VDGKPPSKLPTSATKPGAVSSHVAGAPPINRISQLVADLIAATGLVPDDKLAVARGSLRSDSLAHTLAEQAQESVEEPQALPDSGAEGTAADAALDQLVNSLILQSAEDGASDLHLEPQEDGLLVRMRVDGALREVQLIPKRTATDVIARLKALARLDVDECRIPQHGRMSLDASVAGRRLDLRVATLPTVEGESVVIRLLDRSRRAATLQELGLSEEMAKQLELVIAGARGAVVVTGPAGSGISATLYAVLAEINRPEINVVTVEDAVEHQLPGIKQMQIDEQAGFTYETALRSILRSDPDVVMVGEIRDAETARISVEAALTGHLVLTAVHANDAPQALTRLADMGVDPFLIGSAVSAVLGQRLARKLCAHCCEMYAPSAEELMKARVSPEVAAASDGMVFYRKRGCPRCHQTGYRGRIGIYQLLVVSERLEAIAAANPSREEIERAAIGEGMRTLWDDGLAKVAAGFTSIEELVRVSI
jgi:type IV pilus assembly protein PilB